MDELERKAKRAAYMRAYTKSARNGPCSVDGCSRPSYGRTGLCAMHYQRRRLLGNVGEAAPRFMQGVPTEERFWAKVVRGAPGECWQWTASRFMDGYGLFCLDGKNVGAHRVSYRLLVGEIPDGTELDHLCRNRACVNPAHLEAVSPKVNKLRGESPPARQARQTHCKNGHPLEGPDALLAPDPRLGRRICRICQRAARRRRYQRLGR